MPFGTALALSAHKHPNLPRLSRDKAGRERRRHRSLPPLAYRALSDLSYERVPFVPAGKNPPFVPFGLRYTMFSTCWGVRPKGSAVPSVGTMSEVY